MKLFSKTSNLIAGLSIALGTGLVPVPVSAASAMLSVSPSSGTYLVGSTLTVNIFEDSGANDVDSARADLTYDASALELTGITNAGSPFTTCVTQPRGGNGSLTTGDCTVLGGKKQGIQQLGQASFKVLGNSGTTAIVIANSSQLVSNGIDLSWIAANGAFTMAAPAVRGTTTTPKKTVATTTATAETSDTTPATSSPVTTAEPKEVKTETTIGDDDGSKEEESKTTSSNTWLRLVLLGIAAAGFGYVAARRYKDTDKTASSAKAAAPVAATKPAAKKAKSTAKGKTAKKATPKKTKKTTKKSTK